MRTSSCVKRAPPSAETPPARSVRRAHDGLRLRPTPSPCTRHGCITSGTRTSSFPSAPPQRAPGAGDGPGSVQDRLLSFVAQLIWNGCHPPMPPAPAPFLGVDRERLLDLDANDRAGGDGSALPGCRHGQCSIRDVGSVQADRHRDVRPLLPIDMCSNIPRSASGHDTCQQCRETTGHDGHISSAISP